MNISSWLFFHEVPHIQIYHKNRTYDSFSPNILCLIQEVAVVLCLYASTVTWPNFEQRGFRSLPDFINLMNTLKFKQYKNFVETINLSMWTTIPDGIKQQMFQRHFNAIHKWSTCLLQNKTKTANRKETKYQVIKSINYAVLTVPKSLSTLASGLDCL